MIGRAIPWLFLGSVGGRVIYPNCNLRFELFQFYMDGDEAQPPRSPPLSEDAGEAQPPRSPPLSEDAGELFSLIERK
jgi:hypothetical protein